MKTKDLITLFVLKLTKRVLNKPLSLFPFLIGLTLLLSCGDLTPPIEFTEPIKGRKVNLSKKIGSEIKLKKGNETISIHFSFQNDTNYIIGPEDDTIFSGTATKRNELFLLNRYLSENRILIHGIKLEDSLIVGLGTEWMQTHMYKTFMDSLKLNHIVLKTDTNHIETVGSQKKENKEIFRMILSNLPPDTIISIIN